MVYLELYCPLCTTTMSGAGGQYPLHRAVITRNVEEIDRLIASGVDINERDAAGIPSLHYAIHLGYLDVVNHLIAKGIQHHKI